MNMFYILLKLLLIICIYLLIIYKKYDILFFYVIFFLIIVYKFNNIKEGFKNVTIDELSKMNTLLDKLIKLFNTNRNDCIGEYHPLECDKECGYGSRDNIYTIIQQSGETGLPCPHKEGSIKKTKCINDLCNEGDKCINNNDCVDKNCVDGFCKDKYDCSDTYIDYCNTYDKCNSLNSDISGVTYTWSGSSCIKEDKFTDNNSSGNNSPAPAPAPASPVGHSPCTVTVRESGAREVPKGKCKYIDTEAVLTTDYVSSPPSSSPCSSVLSPVFCDTQKTDADLNPYIVNVLSTCCVLDPKFESNN